MKQLLIQIGQQQETSTCPAKHEGTLYKCGCQWCLISLKTRPREAMHIYGFLGLIALLFMFAYIFC